MRGEAHLLLCRSVRARTPAGAGEQVRAATTSCNSTLHCRSLCSIRFFLLYFSFLVFRPTLQFCSSRSVRSGSVGRLWWIGNLRGCCRRDSVAQHLAARSERTVALRAQQAAQHATRSARARSRRERGLSAPRSPQRHAPPPLGTEHSLVRR